MCAGEVWSGNRDGGQRAAEPQLRPAPLRARVDMDRDRGQLAASMAWKGDGRPASHESSMAPFHLLKNQHDSLLAPVGTCSLLPPPTEAT